MPNPGFISYLRTQKKLLLLATLASVLCFALLKYCFPYPDFFVDSFSYVEWAYSNYSVAFRPTGYCYFLKFLHSISTSATLVVFTQYLLFFFSSLFCLLSTDYLFGLPPRWKMLVMWLIVLDPLLLLQTNLISTDSLFCSLTVVWFTVLLWLMRRGNIWLLIVQALLLYLSLELRFTALFFPVLSLVAIVFAAKHIRCKIIGIALTALVVIFNVQRQKYLNGKTTGTHIYSGFSGWQMANNVLYYYKHLDISTSELPNVETQFVDKCVKHFIDSIPVQDGDIGVVYLWDKRSPLKKCHTFLGNYNKMHYYPAWFATSKIFNDYGWYIVKNYPGAHLKYFIYPNTIKYFYPDLEILEDYYVTRETVPDHTKEWFNNSFDDLSGRFPELQRNIVKIFPGVSLLLNVFNIVVVLLFAVTALSFRKRTEQYQWQLFAAWATLYFCFMGFTIFASSVNLRFMNHVFVLGIIMPVALLKWSLAIRRQV